LESTMLVEQDASSTIHARAAAIILRIFIMLLIEKYSCS